MLHTSFTFSPSYQAKQAWYLSQVTRCSRLYTCKPRFLGRHHSKKKRFTGTIVCSFSRGKDKTHFMCNIPFLQAMRRKRRYTSNILRSLGHQVKNRALHVRYFLFLSHEAKLVHYSCIRCRFFKSALQINKPRDINKP